MGLSHNLCVNKWKRPGSGLSPLVCPHSKRFAMRADTEEEEQTEPEVDPQKRSSGMGPSVQNHCKEQVGITHLLFKFF